MFKWLCKTKCAKTSFGSKFFAENCVEWVTRHGRNDQQNKLTIEACILGQCYGSGARIRSSPSQKYPTALRELPTAATENSDDYTFFLREQQAKAASVVSFYNAL